MIKTKQAARAAANRSKSAVFSTRMDPDLRRQLEKSANAHSKGNISREMDRLLREALAFQKQPDKQLRAIHSVIGQMAVFLGPKWKTDPWLFRAFKTAVAEYLALLSPPAPQNGLKRPDDISPANLEARAQLGEIFLTLEIDGVHAATCPEGFGALLAKAFDLVMRISRVMYQEGESPMTPPQIYEALREMRKRSVGLAGDEGETK